MAARRTLRGTTIDRENLIDIRDHHEKPYMRERAAAIIKVMDGQSPHDIALHGLLKPRNPDTVYAWVDRFKEYGLDGLKIRPGRGRKPAFSPSSPEC
jgi:transposase